MSLIRWLLSPLWFVAGFFIASAVFAALLGFASGLGFPDAIGALSFVWIVGVVGGVYTVSKSVGVL